MTTNNSIVPATPLEIVPKVSDAEMGEHLTAQYQRATGGMTEVLKFGAMMMLLRDHLSNSTRGVGPARGRHSDGGIKAWLKQHAPEIKEATAYRFLHVAEGVAEEFRLPPKVNFPELATAPSGSLTEKLKEKQQELWDFVAGTSQRSWLDRFKPAAPKGGARPKTRPPKSPEDQEAAARLEAQTVYGSLHRALHDIQVDHAKLIGWLPVLSDDLVKQMDLHHLELSLVACLGIVQDAITSRDETPSFTAPRKRK